ncbi:MFS transporter [Psychrobacter sp. LFX-11D]|uniref:MFS transporter n=1 Tax=Psychrobacter sp. LFX-11D TaxID=458201 RepID=UPI0019183179|nr:MFS transporter [Psychrobacter sp. LFX-11D]
MSYRMMVAIVLCCHYLSAFSALGMPLFLPIMLQELNAPLQSGWVGLLFILPTLMTAIAARYWGIFADTYGRKTSLLRAELGLAVGFLICGFSQSLWQLVIGLSVQGLFGGTMAASNAYLATSITDKNALKQVLNFTQFSARLALITAPIGLGFLVHHYEVLSLYRVLAILPLLALLLSFLLKKDVIAAGNIGTTANTTELPKASTKTKTKTKTNNSNSNTAKSDKKETQHSAQSLTSTAFFANPYLFISVLQFFLAFCMVATFPYFLPFAKTFGLSTSQIGQLYAMPHVMYLICQLLYGRISQRLPAMSLSLGFTVLASAVLLHLTDYLPLIWLARMLFGVGMFMCYQSLHTQMADTNQSKHSGKIFSRYDALAKWGGVLAGLSVTLFVPMFGLLSPFVLSAMMAVIAIITIKIYQEKYSKTV